MQYDNEDLEYKCNIQGFTTYELATMISIKYLNFIQRWQTFVHQNAPIRIRFKTSFETDDICYKRIDELIKIEDMLDENNNMKEKQLILNKLLIKRIKKEFLKNIESTQLPHDLENLIFTYLY